jgi:hypothetical protein
LAPYLILAGDSGRFTNSSSYLAFLKIQNSRFVEVFLVPGNYDTYEVFYGDSLELARTPKKNLEGYGKDLWKLFNLRKVVHL